MFWPQVSGLPFAAATAAAWIVVRGLAYQDLALDVHRLCGSQELEGLECETGIAMGTSHVGLVGVVHTASKGETETVLQDYTSTMNMQGLASTQYLFLKLAVVNQSVQLS